MKLPDISHNKKAQKLKRYIFNNEEDKALQFIKRGKIRNIDAQALFFSISDDEVQNKTIREVETLLFNSVISLPQAPKYYIAAEQNAISGNLQGIKTLLSRNALDTSQLREIASLAASMNNMNIVDTILKHCHANSIKDSANIAKSLICSKRVANEHIHFLVDYVALYKERSKKALGFCIANLIIDDNMTKFQIVINEIISKGLSACIEESIEISVEDEKQEYVIHLLPLAEKTPALDISQIEDIFSCGAEEAFLGLSHVDPPAKIALLVKWKMNTSRYSATSLMKDAPIWMQEYFLAELNNGML